MNSNPISSMTQPDRAPASGLAEVLPKGDRELAGLARLDAVLKLIEQSLSAGKVEGLPEICREAASIANDMSSLYAQSPLLASLAEDGERRKTLLSEIRRKHGFCVAVLRRWRRMLALRREVLNLAGEQVTYTPILMAAAELR
jgi:hypothetical protein